MVTVDVLLAAAAWAVWSFLVGPAFLALTPPLWARLTVAPRRFALLVPAFVLGAATHVAWDSFTHAGMSGVAHVAALRARYGPLPGYAWAQYASTLIGAVVLLWWGVRWWRTRPARALPPHRPWESPAAWAVTTAAALAGALWSLPSGGTWTDVAYDTTTTGGGAAAVTVLVIATVWRCTR